MAALTSFIKANVETGNVIFTDQAAFYNRLDDEGFTHGTVNHSFTFKDPVTAVHTNLIEGTFGLYRQWHASMHGLKGMREAHKSYLNQFCWLRSFTFRDAKSIFRQLVRAFSEVKG